MFIPSYMLIVQELVLVKMIFYNAHFKYAIIDHAQELVIFGWKHSMFVLTEL